LCIVTKLLKLKIMKTIINFSIIFIFITILSFTVTANDQSMYDKDKKSSEYNINADYNSIKEQITISFRIHTKGKYRVYLTDGNNNEITELHKGVFPDGHFEVIAPTINMNSGTYYICIDHKKSTVKKVIIIGEL